VDAAGRLDTLGILGRAPRRGRGQLAQLSNRSDRQTASVSLGNLHSRSYAFPLPDSSEIGVRQSIRGRLIGYGTIIITPAGRIPSTFNFIAYPQQVYLLILNLDEDNEDK
jgi:hypothetical protein